jgi:hypothetical protein
VRLLRSLIAAIATLALTAAFATAHQMPSASVDGLGIASQASGGDLLAQLSSLQADQADELQADESDQPEADQEELDQEDVNQDEVDTESSDSHCIAPVVEDTTSTNVDEQNADDQNTGDQLTTEEPNHGAVVCGAAQAETPDGYANHGAYVREFAQDNGGAEKSAEAKAKHSDGGAAAASTTRSGGHGKGHGRH